MSTRSLFEILLIIILIALILYTLKENKSKSIFIEAPLENVIEQYAEILFIITYQFDELNRLEILLDCIRDSYVMSVDNKILKDISMILNKELKKDTVYIMHATIQMNHLDNSDNLNDNIIQSIKKIQTSFSIKGFIDLRNKNEKLNQIYAELLKIEERYMSFSILSILLTVTEIELN